MAEIENILRGCISPEAEIRQNAEATIAQMLTSTPDSLAEQLIAGMALPEPALSQLAAVLFRLKFVDQKNADTLQPQTRLACRTAIYGLIVAERSLALNKKFCDALSGLHVMDKTEGEFLNSILPWINSPDSSIKELAMYAYELATEYPDMMTCLRANPTQANELLTKGLQDPELAVRVTAVKATASFLGGFEEEEAVMVYEGVMGQLLTVLTMAVEQLFSESLDDEVADKVKHTLTSLSELTQAHPRLWMNHLDNFIVFTTTIAKTTSLEEEFRSAGVELLVTLLTKAPGMCRRNAKFAPEAVALGLALIAEVPEAEDLNAWNEAEDENDKAIVNLDPHSLGKDLLYKLPTFLKGENVLPLLLKAIPEYLKSTDWVSQHTGLLTLGFIAEGCHDSYAQNLGEIVGYLLPFTTSEHPRVKWAAMTSIGLICQEFESEAQKQFHAQIMPGLIGCMSADNMRKTQTQAASATINYLRGLADDAELKVAISPYKDALINVLQALLQSGVDNGCYPLLEEVLNCLSILASVLDDEFVPYYGALMAGLKTLVGMPCTSHKQKEVRAFCIKAMGHMVEATGEPCKADANDIFMQLCNLMPTLEFDDPALIVIKETSPAFAYCLKEDFAPYMSGLMQTLLVDAAKQVDVSLTDAEAGEDTANAGQVSLNFQIRGLGTKRLAINTSELEGKIKAVEIIYNLINKVGKAANDFVEPTIEVMSQLFNYRHNEDVRKYSIKTVGQVVHCLAQPEKAEAILRVIIPIYATNLTNSLEVFPKDTKRMLRSLINACEGVQCSSVIGLPQANEMSGLLAKCVEAVFERKVGRQTEKAKYTDAELYTEELEVLQEEDQVDEEIVRAVMEVVGKFLKGFKQQYQQTFVTFFKSMYNSIFYKPDATEIEILSAVCIFDDYIEHTGDVMLEQGQSKILEEMMKACNHTNSDIRHSASYGVGLCSQAMPAEVFGPHAQNAVQLLANIIKLPDARSEDNTGATDSAIGSLGKIALLHCNEVIPDWLSQMPLKSDPDEAQSANKLFLQNVAQLKAYPQTMTVLQELDRLTREEAGLNVLDAEGASLLAQAPSLIQ